jgi:hypothetical protein
MEVSEPRLRRRGFFMHSDTGEPDSGELENPEGFIVRVRLSRSRAARPSRVTSRASAGTRFSGGGRQSRIQERTMAPSGAAPIRSATATDSRQQSHSLR